jgi:hypothetical protein
MGKIVTLPLKDNVTHKSDKFVNIGAVKQLISLFEQHKGHGELVVAEMFRQRESLRYYSRWRCLWYFSH